MNDLGHGTTEESPVASDQEIFSDIRRTTSPSSMTSIRMIGRLDIHDITCHFDQLFQPKDRKAFVWDYPFELDDLCILQVDRDDESIEIIQSDAINTQDDDLEGMKAEVQKKHLTKLYEDMCDFARDA